MSRLTRSLATPRCSALGVVAICLSLAACDVPHDDVDDEVAIVVAPMRGAAYNGAFAGIVSVAVAGQADTHTGLLVAPGLVLTSRNWVDYATQPGNVTVTSGASSQTPQARRGRYVNANAFVAASVVQVNDFLDGHARFPAIDNRSNLALQNVLVRCYEFSEQRSVASGEQQYRDNTLLWAPMRVAGSNADGTLTLAVDSTDKFVEHADAGAVCMDESTRTAVGMVTGVFTGQARILPYRAMSPWINGLRNLAAVRDDGRSMRWAFYTLGTRGERMCLDLPWGSHFEQELINVYPCHYGPAQRFWYDFRIDTLNPRIVSDASGQCFDVPNGSTSPGNDMQQFACHSGANQRFRITAYNDAVGGLRIQPVHALAQNLCLGVEGGASSTPRATETQVCNGNIAQRWFPVGL